MQSGVSTVGWVAQSVEQRTENPCVGGSIPPPATTFNAGEFPNAFALKSIPNPATIDFRFGF
jgi:hypothetical protein